MFDVGIVLVHYSNEKDAIRFLRHLAMSPMPDECSRCVIVVDNGGTLRRSVIEQEGERGHLLQPRKNLGYLNGANFGVNAFKDQYGGQPKWWIIANPDLQISPTFFQRLLGPSWPDSAALLSPDVREGEAWPRNPFLARRPSSFRMWIRRVLFSTTMLTAPYVEAARWKRVVARPPSVPVDPKRIYATHGSLMVFNQQFFEQGGTLEYGGFLYGEEIHVAEQVRRMGLDVLWAPALRAHHRGGATMERVPIDQRRQWWKQSYEFLYRTYFQTD